MGGEATLLSADEDASVIGIMAAISAVDIGAFDRDAGGPLGLHDLRRGDVAVIRVSRQRGHR